MGPGRIKLSRKKITEGEDVVRMITCPVVYISEGVNLSLTLVKLQPPPEFLRARVSAV